MPVVWAYLSYETSATTVTTHPCVSVHLAKPHAECG